MFRVINKQKKDVSKDKREYKELLSSKNIIKSEIESLNLVKEKKEIEIQEKKSDLEDVISEIKIKEEEAKVVSFENEKEEKKLSDLKEDVVRFNTEADYLKSEISKNNKSNKLILDNISVGNEKKVSLNTEIKIAKEEIGLLKDINVTLVSNNSYIKKQTDELSVLNNSLEEEKISLEKGIANLDIKKKDIENEFLFSVQKWDQEVLNHIQEKSEMQTEISVLTTEKKEAINKITELSKLSDNIKKEIQQKINNLLAVKDSLSLNLKKEQIANVNKDVDDFIKSLNM